jgi:hypothetical protein
MRGNEANQPIDPETFRRVFSTQLERYQKLFWEAMTRYGKPLEGESPLLSVAITFVENLMLCPTEEAALTRMQQDLESARIVYIIGGDLGRSLDAAYAQFLIQASHDQTPFFELACAVRVKLMATLDEEGPNYKL